MITDTGATTELHNTQESPGALPKKYDALINWDNQQMDAGELKSGLNFALSGRTIWGKRASFFSFETTSVFNAGCVGVSNDGGDYFLTRESRFSIPTTSFTTSGMERSAWCPTPGPKRNVGRDSRGGQGILRYGSRACGSLKSEKDTERLGDVGNSSGDGVAG
jgi:hypothetical protein